jgi:murein DD-endopeptidase MepM/ murein hydrolase activator NlpD
MPGKSLGDGFFIRHGDQVENTWYNPGYWHTGEDWYAIAGDSAGARVYAIADGAVEYIGGNYPGRVVIVRHADDLYSMYGHLDPQVNTSVGAQVTRGELIGTVLRRSDTTPSHLHFEIRTFLTSRAVNGSAPRYDFRCGVNCPPGPGYWPIQAPDLPSDLGWRTPAHVIAQRMYPPDAPGSLGQVVVASQPISPSIALWSGPPEDTARSVLDTLALRAGEHFPLLEVRADREDSHATSALGYQIWYAIGLTDGRTAWVQAAIPSTFEIGSDGRPSSVYFNFWPAVEPRP